MFFITKGVIYKARVECSILMYLLSILSMDYNYYHVYNIICSIDDAGYFRSPIHIIIMTMYYDIRLLSRYELIIIR